MSAPTYGPCSAECNGCPECDPGLRPDAESDALTEAVRFYLAAYLLPANVAAYYAPGDDHRTVADRCAPLLVEHIARVLPPGSGRA